MSTFKKSLITALAAATLLGLSPVGGYSDATAQFRRPPPGFGPGGGGRPGPGPVRAAPRRGGGGGAAAGAAFGLIAGALISGAMEQQRQQEYQRQRVYDDEVEYCMERFRSYDPRTGTYRGRDGRLYRCP